MSSKILVVIFAAIIGLAVTGKRAPPEDRVRVVTTAQGTREVRIRRSEDGHFYVHAMVNGQLVRFLVDTGATQIALTLEDAERVGESFSPDGFEVVGSGASGPVYGQFIEIDSIELGGREVGNLPGAVVDKLDISLLGQAFLSRARSVQMNADEMIIR